MSKKTYTFCGIEDCYVHINPYKAFGGSNDAITLVSSLEGPVSRITVNLPDLQPGEIALDYNNQRKQWNKVLDIIRDLGYEYTGKDYQSGFCSYPVYRKKQ